MEGLRAVMRDPRERIIPALCSSRHGARSESQGHGEPGSESQGQTFNFQFAETPGSSEKANPGRCRKLRIESLTLLSGFL